MARVRDARTTRAGSHAEVTHQAGASTARGSVMQGSGMLGGGRGRRAPGAPRLRAAAGSEDPHAVAELEGEPLCP
eukprot:5546626-Prymnesium_polylepis.1